VRKRPIIAGEGLTGEYRMIPAHLVKRQTGVPVTGKKSRPALISMTIPKDNLFKETGHQRIVTSADEANRFYYLLRGGQH
jgi:hypothetical protein